MNEATLEEKFIEELTKNGYTRVAITNFEELELNLRKQINKLNKIELNDDEFERIKNDLNRNKRTFEASRFLRSLYILERSDTSKKEIWFFDPNEFERNVFQVTNQFKVKGKHNNNRYDVTLLINGLPLVHIELKRNTVDVSSAFNQIERYKKESMLETYFEYVQLFITSNENSTYYISNNLKLNKKHLYDWKDENNNVIGNLFEFTRTFLKKEKLSKYLAKYIILSEDKEGDEKLILAMRSYQVIAAEKILEKIKLQEGNGYIWHTTGSGKTLTSFKSAQLISEFDYIDKVLFVVDRVDLDTQTVSEYNKFLDRTKNISSNEDGTIATVQTTAHLKTLLENNKDKIIVTTIQKLSKLTEKGKLKNKLNVVLIFDECHRSQLGDMHLNIDKYFNYPQKFGFTGTPILPQNRKDKHGLLTTTADVFGEKLHAYLINDAISDGNVLGFQIDYNKVLKLKDESNIIDQDVEAINTKELFEDINYIRTVAFDIVETFDRFTQNSNYNAMLATSGINSAIKYYKLLTGKEVDGVKLDLPEEFKNKKIACIYSVQDNEESRENSSNNRESYIEIMNDYNKNFNRTFNYESKAEFKNDIATKVKNKEIDLLIVSDMFLTGFDAKCLNTMYFDKKQQYHNLIQSVSRTNRIYDDAKDYGQIIFYQPAMKKAMDDALELFSNPNSDVPIIKEEYSSILEKTIEQMNILKLKYSNFDIVNNLHEGEEEKEYLTTVRNALRCMNAIETYREFNIEDLPISKNLLDQHSAKYKEIYTKYRPNRNVESVLDDFDFEIELVKTDKIDYDYITNILGKIDNSVDTTQEVLHILTRFETDPSLKSKYALLKLFFENYYNIDSPLPIEVQFNDAIEHIVFQKIAMFSELNDLETEKVVELNEEYRFTNDYNLAFEKENEVVKKFNFIVKDEIKTNLRNFILHDINGGVIDVDDIYKV